MKKLPRLILFSFLLLNSFQSSATHVVGGELNYRWIGGNNYEIRLTVFRDCINGVPPFDNPASIGIFNSANNLVNINYSYTGFYPDPYYNVSPPYYNNATFNNQTYGFLILPHDSATVPNTISSPCEIPPANICYRVCHYIDTITLPPIAGGYHLAYQRCCRNFSIANIVNPLNTGSTYDAWIPASPNNFDSNPVFTYLPATYICVNNPFVFDHSATDYEGDSLVYQLCDPLQGATNANSVPQPPNNPPYATITWQPPYSLANIFGGVPLTINPQTGLLTATPNSIGQFVYAVCVIEYRNGVPIGETRRDFQVNIVACANITVASLLASTVACGSHTATFTNNSTGASTYHWDFGDLSTNADTSNLFSPSYTYPDTGWYNVTLIAYSSVNTACNDTSHANVHVRPLPVVTVTSPPPICIGQQSALITASGTSTSYTWSPSTGLSNTTGSSVTASPASTTTYTVTGTLNGCTASAQVTVTVNPLPVIAVTPPPAICIGQQSATLTANGASTYSWTPATALSATTGSTVTANPSSTATYTVTGTDNNGCTASTQVTVTVNPLPVIAVTPPPAICVGQQNATLTANGASTYSWTPATALSATTGSTVTANPTSTTSYTVTGTDNNGCTASTQVTVTVNPLLVIAVTPPPAICVGQQSATLTANGASTYSWTPATALSATTGSTVTANPTSTTSYTVTGTDNNGCIASTQVTVTVNPLPVIAATPPPAICVGQQSATLVANGASTYSWTPATALSATTGSAVTANPTSTITYTVTGTDNNGCTASTQVTVTVNPLPVIAVAPPPAICVGQQSATLTANGASTYSWTPATALSATTGSSVTANPTSTTTYTVTGTDINGCTASTQVTVNVNPLPVVTVSSASICNGQSTTLSANGANTYSWSPATSLSATTGSTVTANPASTITYTVTGIDNNGCTSTGQGTVSVTTVAVTVSPNTAICNGFPTTLSANGATTYSWSPAASLSSSIGSSVSANPNATTTYTVIGTTNGCTASAQVTITVNGIILAVSPATICQGQSTTLTVNGATNYSWSPSNTLSSSTGASVTANPATTTTYTVTGTSNGCSGTAQVTVTVNPLPLVAVTPPPAICVGQQNATITANGASTYSWTPATALSATTGSTVTATPISTTTYTVTGTDNNGCTASTQVTVTVNPLPVIAVAPPPAICVGQQSATLTANGASTYSWTPATALSATTGSSVTATPASTITYTVTGTDNNGCTASAQVTVTVNPLPQPSFTFQVATCSRLVTFTNTSSNTVSSSWNFGDASISNLANPSHTYSVNGNYNVTLIVTSSYGCTDTIVNPVVINYVPVVAAFNPANTLCSYDFNFTNQSTGASSYNWNFGDANTSTQTSPSHTYAASGNYTVTLIANNVNGCADTTSQNVSMQPLAQANFNYQTDTCSLTVTFANNSANASAYSWNFGDATTSSQQNPVHTYSSTGNYNVTLIATTAAGCNDTVAVAVPLSFVLPAAAFTINPSPCSFNISLNNQSTGANNYSWNFGDNTTSTAQNPSHTYLQPGNYTVTLSIAGVASCADSITHSVTIDPLPAASFTQLLDTCTLSATFNNTSQNAILYSWNFGDASTSTQANPSHTYSAAGNYTVTLTVTDVNGCTAAATQSFAFSPLPVAAFLVNQSPCSFSISLNNQSAGANTYHWDFGDNTTSTLQNPSHTYALPGNYTIALITSGVASCADTVSQSIIVNPLPSAAFNSILDVCSLTASFNNNSLNGILYSWNFGDATTSTQQTPVHTYSSSGNYTVTLTVTDVNGCTATAIQSFSFPALPVSAFSHQVDLCSRLATFANNSVNAVSYIWNFGDATNSSVQSPTHLYAANGNYNVTLIATSASGCSDTLTIPVSVNYVPVIAAFNLVNIPCTFYVSFANQSTGGASYYWSFGDNYFSSQLNPNHYYSSGGNYTITLVSTDANGCSDSSSQNISLPVPAQASFSFVTDSCTRLVSFTNSSINGNSYYWNFGDAGTSSQMNPAHTYSTNGNYNVSLVATSSSGCADTMVIPVPITISLPVAAFTPAPDVCSFDVNFTNLSVNASTYAWNFGDNTTSYLANPTHAYQNSGSYNITLVVSTTAGCIDSTANNVGVAPVPVASFTSQIDTCSLVAQFMNNSQNAANYYWNFGDSTTSVSGNPPAHTYPATGSYNVMLVVEDNNGCRDTMTKTLNPFISSKADYTYSIDTCAQQVNFFNQSDFAFSYLWDFGDGQTSSEVSQSHHYPSDGNYPVLLITNPGTVCADTAKYTVDFSLLGIGNIYVPNAFTPNSDGKNDIFEIVGYYPCEDLTLYIFDRWGEMIYKASGKHITWDGNYIRNRVKLEVYVYILQGTYFYQKGTITVIR